MRRIVVTCALLAALLAPQLLSAWNATGHMTVAYIAYKSLWDKPGHDTRARVDQLLKLFPDYPKWVEGLPDDAQVRALVAFEKASVWPDTIKGDARFYDENRPPGTLPPALPGFPDMKMHKNWHFIDVPISTDGSSTLPADSPNALVKIEEFRAALGNPNVTPEVQAYDLVWLIHLIGDIHQPLHATQRFTNKEQRGDLGGNRFLIGDETKNLHAFWDDILGTDRDTQTITTLGSGIMSDIKVEKSDNMKTQAWVDESVAIAKSFVYKLGEDDPNQPPPSISPEYRREAIEIGRRRVAQAGYRLAAVLNERLK